MKRALHARPGKVPGIVVLLLMLVGGGIGLTQITGAESRSVKASEAASVTAAPRIRGNVEKALPSDAKVSSVTLPEIRGMEQAQLTYAPEVPPAIKRKHA